MPIGVVMNATNNTAAGSDTSANKDGKNNAWRDKLSGPAWFLLVALVCLGIGLLFNKGIDSKKEIELKRIDKTILRSDKTGLLFLREFLIASSEGSSTQDTAKKKELNLVLITGVLVKIRAITPDTAKQITAAGSESSLKKVIDDLIARSKTDADVAQLVGLPNANPGSLNIFLLSPHALGEVRPISLQ
jgi:hypothetical protein